MCSYHIDDKFDFDPLQQDVKFRYQLLDRLRSDCEYYLGAGHRQVKHLWGRDITSHINLMRRLWFSFDVTEKPEWISLAKIQEYENRMLD